MFTYCFHVFLITKDLTLMNFFLKTSSQIFVVVLGLNEETCAEAPTLLTRFANV